MLIINFYIHVNENNVPKDINTKIVTKQVSFSSVLIKM